jgi:hypothetical protein
MTSLGREHFIAANMFPVKSLSDSKKSIISLTDTLTESPISISADEQAADSCGGDLLAKLDSMRDLKSFAKAVADDIVIKVDKVNGDILGLLVLNKDLDRESLEVLDEAFYESRRSSDR